VNGSKIIGLFLKNWCARKCRYLVCSSDTWYKSKQYKI